MLGLGLCSLGLPSSSKSLLLVAQHEAELPWDRPAANFADDLLPPSSSPPLPLPPPPPSQSPAPPAPVKVLISLDEACSTCFSYHGESGGCMVGACGAFGDGKGRSSFCWCSGASHPPCNSAGAHSGYEACRSDPNKGLPQPERCTDSPMACATEHADALRAAGPDGEMPSEDGAAVVPTRRRSAELSALQNRSSVVSMVST